MSRTVLPSSRSARTVSHAARRAAGSKPSSARRGTSARGRRPAPARSRAAAAGRRTACARRRSARRPGRRASTTSSTSRGAGYSVAQCATRLAHGQMRVGAAALQHDPDPRAQLGRARGVLAEHETSPAPRSGSPRGSRPSSSCPRRWGRAGRTPRRGATSKSTPRTRLVLAVGLAQPADLDRGAPLIIAHHGKLARPHAVCACIDIGSNTTRCSSPRRVDGRAPRGPPASARSRASARAEPERRDPTRIASPRSPRSSPRRCALARELGARRSARSPPRRSGGRPTRDEFVRGDPPHAAGVEVARPQRRGGGAARVRRRDPDARACRPPAGSRWSTSAAAPRRSRRHARRRREWSASFRSAPACWPTPTCTPTRRPPASSTAVAHARPRVFEGLELPTPDAGRRRRRQRDVAAPARRRVLDHETLERGTACSRRAGDEVAQRFELEPERVRLLPAGHAAARRGGARARPAAADRHGRAARGRHAGRAVREPR